VVLLPVLAGAIDTNYVASIRSGDAALEAGQARTAIERFTDAIQRAPRSIPAREKLLAALFAAGDFAEAEKASRELLALSPRSFVGWISLGSAQRRQGHYWQADKTLTRALRYYPSNARLLTELGYVKRARGRKAEARFYFEQAWILDPYNSDGAYWALLDRSLFADLADRTGPDRLREAGVGFGRGYSLEAALYGSTVNYEGSAVKRGATVYGLNGTLGIGREHKLDYGAEYLRIRREFIADLQQWDFTLAYANYHFDYQKLRLGGHLIESSHAGTDGAWIVFAGYERFVPGRWQAGINLNFSRYDRFGPALNVFQLTPYCARTLWRGPVASLQLNLAGHYIQPSHRAGLPLRHYASGEGGLSLQWRDWTVAGFGWAGKQAFALRGGGYTPFNVAEEHRRGFGAEVRRVTGPRTAVSMRYTREYWRELAGNRAASDAYLATLGISF